MMRRKAPLAPTLNYASPSRPHGSRSAGRMLGDFLVGASMIVGGLAVCVIGAVIDQISSWELIDRGADMIPNGLRKIAGKRPPERYNF